MRILVINPGSTSTKIGLFLNNNLILNKTFRHTSEEIGQFNNVTSQYNFRLSIIEDFLKNTETDINSLNAVVGIGGLIRPVKGGTYIVNEKMVNELKQGMHGEHASNLGAILAYYFAKKINKQAFISDPVVVDEFNEIARISGHPKFERRSIFHALNQKAIAYKYSKEINKPYNNLNLIVVHMGGGISVGAHQKGNVIDANNALNGDGPFTPERSGSLPVAQLVDTCFGGEYTKQQVHSMILGKGGLVAYCGTNNLSELESKNDPQVNYILQAMAYQISKEIGFVAPVMKGDIDAILLTGGIAHSKLITDEIISRVSFIAPVRLYPGEDELKALAESAIRVLTGKEAPKTY